MAAMSASTLPVTIGLVRKSPFEPTAVYGQSLILPTSCRIS